MQRKANAMAIPIDGKTTVRELVGRYPQTRRVFEEHGIDYCCGGGQTLAEAAKSRNLDLQRLRTALDSALQTAPGGKNSTEPDWYGESLRTLVDHIVQTHHAYLRTALPQLRLLTQKVLSAHGAHHGKMLQEVRDLCAALDAELSSHLLKEERVLFPTIAAIEDAARSAAPAPQSTCGTVGNPIRQMEYEHEDAGGVLARLREATGGYALPPDACPTFAALYEELQRLEADLHQHIHLENNVLFPRALELERSLPPCQ
jgi:regulator of cell morphogenesis and NO signaling